ncbi:unnamed protein product [Adineta steineri]|uniref:NAD(P)(+)--arginine ADP-ribosyltransferase n=1 Tax=Adineta steineri TaxID=433720 RepID=A0A819FST6_9BILA|nr:unnamed protein product [Adineta steineri]CAF3870631.1 unnamed protein product [Adineta steineri]
MVHTVKFNCKNPPDNLSPDESAAIMLYTLPWQPEKESFYSILNSTLRAEDQTNLKSWFWYLKLSTTALSKLSSQRQFLYRGIKKNPIGDYPQGKPFFWWSFTSCTDSIDVLKSELFLGKTGKRTIFTIDACTGKDIQKHSMVKTENEVLLLPGCQFRVIGTLDVGNDLNMIQIQEIDSQCAVSTSSKTLPPSLPIKAHNFQSYHNVTLEQIIQNCQPRKLNLSGQQLNDEDMGIVSNQGIIDKQCKILDLMSTGLTPRGVSILSDAIYNSQYLEELNISHNNISDSGVKHLASVINSSALKRIDLSENDISDEGAGYLAEMFQSNVKLVHLSLAENRIGNTGVKVLADALNHGNVALEVLNLSASTDINDDSIHTLVDMIKQNRSLKKLDLRHCDLTEDCERELQTVAKSRKKFQLWLSHVM